jgi:hypothetical protein
MMAVTIRTFQPGDEAIQAEIYNEAAGDLPKFKPASTEEVGRRCRSAEFDPGTRFYAEDGGKVVGYAVFNANGRVSVPWCRRGHEGAAEPLFQSVLQAMTSRGIATAFAAYRADWPAPLDFLQRHGFRLAREMLNYVMELNEMPTRMDRPGLTSPLRREDMPAVLELAPQALRVKTAAELEKVCFSNPYFTPDAFFAVRNRKTGEPTAVGLLIINSTYANPLVLDANMPCFRLGAFGTEGMQVKRINGLFSVLMRDEFEALAQAHALMGHAGQLLEKADMTALAAQTPSDVPHLARFYKQYLRRQGSFPVYERALTA